MIEPNIFTLAPKELVQDAFISWLAKWASPAFREVNKDLHEIGQSFVKSLISKNSPHENIQINEIIVEMQFHHIDVLIVVNKKHFILIEDKIGSNHHDDQLERYKEEIFKSHHFQNITAPILHCIYFKTIEQSNISEVVKAGYALYSRSDLLRILEKGIELNINHRVFCDYVKYIKEIDSIIGGYENMDNVTFSEKKMMSIASPWIGFFERLKKEDVLKNASWAHVHTGGFWGCWFPAVKMNGTEIYIQLEEKSLCFKINSEKCESSKQDIRSHWHQLISEASVKLNFQGTRPNKFGSGKTMTVFEKNDYFVTDTTGNLDLNSTVEQIIKAFDVLTLAQKDERALQHS